MHLSVCGLRGVSGERKNENWELHSQQMRELKLSLFSENQLNAHFGAGRNRVLKYLCQIVFKA